MNLQSLKIALDASVKVPIQLWSLAISDGVIQAEKLLEYVCGFI
jgi:hypothetical protein